MQNIPADSLDHLTCQKASFMSTSVNTALPASFVIEAYSHFYPFLPAVLICSSSVFSIFNRPNIAVTYCVTLSTCSDMLVIEKVLTSLSDLLAYSDVNEMR